MISITTHTTRGECLLQNAPWRASALAYTGAPEDELCPSSQKEKEGARVYIQLHHNTVRRKAKASSRLHCLLPSPSARIIGLGVVYFPRKSRKEVPRGAAVRSFILCMCTCVMRMYMYMRESFALLAYIRLHASIRPSRSFRFGFAFLSVSSLSLSLPPVFISRSLGRARPVYTLDGIDECPGVVICDLAALCDVIWSVTTCWI